jgi:hypothetical protein
MVTAVANPPTKQVHNSKERMPAILNDDLAWRWISEDLTDEEILEIAATVYPYQEMPACTVASDFLGKLDPSEPFVYENLPALELAIEPTGDNDSTESQTSLF